MIKNVTPAKLIHRIVSAKWDWGGETFRILPVEPDALFEALGRAAGADVARVWLREYANGVRGGRFPEEEVLPLEMIQSL
jgi:hypothetical protein